MSGRTQILIVEDEELLARTYAAYLSELPCDCRVVYSGEDALTELSTHPPHILLLDLLLPGIDGFQVLEHIRKQKLVCRTLVVTTEASAASAVRALQGGASDYLVKPIDADRLRTTVANEIERLELQQTVEGFRDQLPKQGLAPFVGSSPQMQAVYRVIQSAALSDANVFVTGESGTGKELCVQAIHRLSHRRDGPLISLNCAAIPPELMESELFGHLKGAFTGAQADRPGAAARADRGILFFDEICEMPLDLQAKLLRFVQSRRYTPVGSDRERRSDIRFICATNKDPFDQVKLGRFREDLYYRLYVLPIAMPALRQRTGDVRQLAWHFLKQSCQEERKPLGSLSEEALRTLESYDWPGNVRQLQNLMRNLVILGQGGEIGASAVQQLLADTGTAVQGQRRRDRQSTEIRPLWVEEQEIIERAVRLCNGDVAEAARRLQISDSTIYRKRKRWEEGGKAGNNAS